MQKNYVKYSMAKGARSFAEEEEQRHERALIFVKDGKSEIKFPRTCENIAQTHSPERRPKGGNRKRVLASGSRRERVYK